jgi:hypothetical protein
VEVNRSVGRAVFSPKPPDQMKEFFRRHYVGVFDGVLVIFELE